MRYSNLKINNFRGVTHLEIDDLKQINLIVGRNNSGKSTVLEAFFLISGMGNPQLPVNIHSFRDLALTSDEDFCYMFQSLDFETPITFSGVVDGKKRDMTIAPKYVNYNENEENIPKKKFHCFAGCQLLCVN